jgi:hypothetical protein
MASELQLSGDESRDELFLDDVAEGEQFVASELQLSGEKTEDKVLPDDVANGEQS